MDSQGQERADTRTSPRESPVDCNKPGKGPSQQYDKVSLFGTSIRAHVHNVSGCMCSVTEYFGTFFETDEPERPKTRCEQHRESLQTTGPEGHPIAGASAPRCDARGEYAPLQVRKQTWIYPSPLWTFIV